MRRALILLFIRVENSSAATRHKTDDVAGASDAPAAGCCVAAIICSHTRAVFLRHVRLEESKVFFFLRKLKQTKVDKSVQLQKIAFFRGGAAHGGNVIVLLQLCFWPLGAPHYPCIQILLPPTTHTSSTPEPERVEGKLNNKPQTLLAQIQKRR